MVNLISENGNEKYGVIHYVVDTPTDVENLPTYMLVGSTCFVISTSEKYMLNSDKEWIKIHSSGATPDEIIYDGGKDETT